MSKTVEVSPLEKALYLIEHGYMPLDTDPIKLAKIIEKKVENLGEQKQILNDINTVYHEK